jgi:hypothetical protein
VEAALGAIKTEAMEVREAEPEADLLLLELAVLPRKDSLEETERPSLLMAEVAVEVRAR